MNCNDARTWIDASADGELDVVRDHELQHHLQVCPSCSARMRELQDMHAALSAVPAFRAPNDLIDRIRVEVADNEPTTPTKVVPFRRPEQPHQRMMLWQVMGIAASIVAVGWLGFRWGETREEQNRFIDESIADHVRSLQAGHLMDVASTDRHTVKPWFAGKVEFSPPVFDEATEGFPLVGGRLDRLNGRTVAALVYRRRQHAINVFVWPATTDSIGTQGAEHDGYNVSVWNAAGFNFLAVSEIPADELEAFASLLRRDAK